MSNGSGTSSVSSNGGGSNNNRNASNGSKFQEVQRRWGVVQTTGTSANASEDEDSSGPQSVRPFQSGSTPVKSLTGRFDKENLIADYETCADASALRQLVKEQMREIETLKSQVRKANFKEKSNIWLKVFFLDCYKRQPYQTTGRDRKETGDRRTKAERDIEGLNLVS